MSTVLRGRTIRAKADSRLTVLRLPAGALLLLTLCFVSSCARQVESAVGSQKIDVGTQLAQQQVFNRHLEGDPPTLDPSLATDVPSFDVIQDLFEGLVTFSADGKFAPGGALSWETGTDGKTWTFHLRPEARWSNGQPVTAKDYVYAWRRQVDPLTASEYAEDLAPIENAAAITAGKLPPNQLGVEVPDPHTLVVHLQAPTEYFPSLLTNCFLFPLYEPAIKQWGEKWTDPGHMISNGPFILTDRIINGHITMIRNPDYWDAAHVRLTTVNYYPLTDDSAAVNRYLAGEIDFTDRVPATDKERLQRLLGSQVVLSPYFGTVMFGFNFTKPPFANNPKLRLALNMAIDRDIIAKYVDRGIGIPAFNVMPPLDGYQPAVPEWANLTDDQRHAMARQLYQEAGYSDSNPLDTVLTYPTASSNRRLMEALSAMWQQNLGARVQIYNIEWKVFLQERTLKEPVLFWHAWIGDFPDPYTFMELFQTGFGLNDDAYHNPQFDALLQQASDSNDQALRYQLFHQAEAVLNADAPIVPVTFYESSHLIKPYVQGWHWNVVDRTLDRYLSILAHQES